MSTIAQPDLTFYAWIRRGLAASLAAGSTSARVSIDLASTDASNKTTVVSKAKTIQLRGPGHVLGLDPALVVRCEPEADATEFEPNLFPFVELASPDLPWRFTPGGVDAKGRLRPWIVLVVARKRDGVRIVEDPALSVPVLEIETDAGLELPDLAESWAWCHVQASETVSTADLGHTLTDEPGLFVTRLVCPRHLQPSTSYVACVVPAFAAGVQAALSPDLADPSLAGDAWTLAPAPSSIRLPVYYRWSFRTGRVGDFEALARKLAPIALGADVGACALDVSAAGGGIPSLPGVRVVFPGALVSTAFRSTPWQGPARQQFETALRGRLLATPDTPAEPVVGPPVYGAAAVARASLGEPGAPRWLDDVNLDPAMRAAAGLGALWVRREQERLVAEAWNQAGDVGATARLLRHSRLAAEVGNRLGRRITATTHEGLLVHLSQPAHARMRGRQGTVLGDLRAGTVPRGFVSPAFRRVARPSGVIGRAYRGAAVPTASRISGAVISGRPVLASLTGRRAPLGLGFLTDAAIGRGNALTTTAGPAKAATLDGGETDRAAPRSSAKLALPSGPPGTATSESRAAADLARAATAARGALGDPHGALARRIRARANGVSALTTSRRVPEAIDLVPAIPYAVAAGIIAMDPELFVPGVGTVPDNRVGILAVHPKTVEAIMVGANAELAAELRWREFPARTGSTMLSCFWTSHHDDIPPIASWKSALGAHLDPASGSGALVFLIRGNLVARYPQARYSVIRAAWSAGTRVPAIPEEQRTPLFRGAIDDRTIFVAFELTEPDARGSATVGSGGAGWYLQIEEPLGRPRLGLDAKRRTGPGAGTTWSDLAWPDVAADDASLAALTHVPLTTRPLVGTTREGIPWGGSAADMARITLQNPVRVQIHASAMLPPRAGGS